MYFAKKKKKKKKEKKKKSYILCNETYFLKISVTWYSFSRNNTYWHSKNDGFQNKFCPSFAVIFIAGYRT